MEQGLLFAPVVAELSEGVNRITTFVSVRVHGGKLAISSPLLAHTGSPLGAIYADAAGAVAQLRVSGEVHVDADGAVLAALVDLWSRDQDDE